MSPKLKYPAILRPLSEEEGGGYLIEFPDLPGCIADGNTIEKAIQEGQDAINSWIKTAKSCGDPIPEPSNPSRYSGQWRLRIPKKLHADLAFQAKQEGVSLNMFAATLLAAGLEHHIHTISD